MQEEGGGGGWKGREILYLQVGTEVMPVIVDINTTKFFTGVSLNWDTDAHLPPTCHAPPSMTDMAGFPRGRDALKTSSAPHSLGREAGQRGSAYQSSLKTTTMWTPVRPTLIVDTHTWRVAGLDVMMDSVSERLSNNIPFYV